jgi:hypothetical protein
MRSSRNCFAECAVLELSTIAFGFVNGWLLALTPRGDWTFAVLLLLWGAALGGLAMLMALPPASLLFALVAGFSARSAFVQFVGEQRL